MRGRATSGTLLWPARPGEAGARHGWPRHPARKACRRAGLPSGRLDSGKTWQLQPLAAPAHVGCPHRRGTPPPIACGPSPNPRWWPAATRGATPPPALPQTLSPSALTRHTAGQAWSLGSSGCPTLTRGAYRSSGAPPPPRMPPSPVLSPSIPPPWRGSYAPGIQPGSVAPAAGPQPSLAVLADSAGARYPYRVGPALAVDAHPPRALARARPLLLLPSSAVTPTPPTPPGAT